MSEHPVENLGAMLTFFRGRVGLRHVLEVLGVGPGDEVVLQAYTCLAVPMPVLALGATPVFVDINRDDLGMSPSDLERKIGPRTKAVLLQHTFGIPADVAGVLRVAAEHGIPVIEDCCHVFGARFEGREIGGFGVAAFYSFEWGKPVVAGVGGGVRVNDSRIFGPIAARQAELRRPPVKVQLVLEVQYLAYRTLLSGRTYWAVRGLYNRLSRLGLLVGTFRDEDFDFQASEEYEWAMAPRSVGRLRRRLADLERTIAHHRRIAALYDQGLHEIGHAGWRLPDGREPVYLRYPIRCVDKDEVLELARVRRVELSGMFRTPVDPLSLEQAERIGYRRGSCPVAEEASKTIVSAPAGLRVRDRDVQRTLDFLRDIAARHLEPAERVCA